MPSFNFTFFLTPIESDMKRLLVFSSSLFLLIININIAYPNSLTNSSPQVNTKALSQNPTWLKLLHFNKNKNHSEILTDDFFLSPIGRQNPEAELIATLDAYFLPMGENPDNHARCQYPARYYWLSKQVNLQNYKLRNPQCRRFEKWALLDNVTSVSLLLVSGYLGNPASTFGHSFIKLNTNSVDDETGFFDF